MASPGKGGQICEYNAISALAQPTGSRERTFYSHRVGTPRDFSRSNYHAYRTVIEIRGDQWRFGGQLVCQVAAKLTSSASAAELQWSSAVGGSADL